MISAEIVGKRSSRAKARDNFVGFTRGLKPPPHPEQYLLKNFRHRALLKQLPSISVVLSYSFCGVSGVKQPRFPLPHLIIFDLLFFGQNICVIAIGHSRDSAPIASAVWRICTE